jgi:hypothetical protein
LGSAGVAGLTTTFEDFFAAVFFTAFAGFAFKVFAPVFARFFSPESGLVAVFFGFFMATILAMGARLLFESKLGIWEAQRLFGFGP